MNLTTHEVERLAILSEECAEVQQVIGKILRHGYDSYNPDGDISKSNRDLLTKELGDLLHSIGMMIDKNDVNETKVAIAVSLRDIRIHRYLHQSIPKNNFIKRLFHFRNSSCGLNCTDKSINDLIELFINTFNENYNNSTLFNINKRVLKKELKEKLNNLIFKLDF